MVDATPPPSRNPDVEASVGRGRELFNRREFFEAHEIWEETWGDSEMEDRHLLQGLIQVAAAFFKLQIGQPRGTVKLLEKARSHLEAVPRDFYNLDIGALLDAADTWQAAARQMLEAGQTEYDAETLPRLHYLEELQ